MTSLWLPTRLLSALLGNATVQLANSFDFINYFNDLRTVPTIVTAHIFCACQGSRARCERNAQHAGRADWFSIPVSLGGSSYFLWKRCVVFQQMKNNFYLPCQFFESRWSTRMLLFLPYGRSDQTFYSQTKVNSNTSKVFASRCYAWSLGIKQSLNR